MKIRSASLVFLAGWAGLAVSGCDAPSQPPARTQSAPEPAQTLTTQQFIVRGTSEVQLRATGAVIVSKVGDDGFVVIGDPRQLPVDARVAPRSARERVDVDLLEVMDADPDAVHRAEVLFAHRDTDKAIASTRMAGTLTPDKRLRFGGALEAVGDRDALLRLAADPAVTGLFTIRENVSMAPQGFEPHNAAARETSNVDALNPGGDLGFDLTGRDIMLGILDNGRIRASHRDFGGRVTYRESQEAFGGHATHVSGTMMGAGLVRPEARGMAYEARLFGYTFFSDVSDRMGNNSHEFTASNHSYGVNVGWRRNDNQWVYSSNASFGKYNNLARRQDEVVYAIDPLWFKAAGNDRGEQPGNATDEQPVDCHRGYDCLSAGSTAKNLIIVAATHDLEGGPDNIENVRPTGFTSYGPTDDGRIKPDLAANGQDLLSVGIEDDESYATLSGTSMATPTVTGIMGLLLELNARHRAGTTLTTAEGKALLIQTARSPLGEGRPDHRLGFGLVDARGAAVFLNEVLTEAPDKLQRGLIGREVLEYELEGTPGEDLVMTLVWTDPPGTANTGGRDDRTPVLVNDLDITLYPPGEESPARYPWRLQPNAPTATALRDGPNRRDNVEKIFVRGEDVVEGTWRVEVRLDAEPWEGRRQAFVIASTASLSGLQEADPLLEVGRVVRVRALESDETTAVTLPIGTPDDGPVGFEIDAGDLPTWLTIDALNGDVPGGAPTATLNPSGLSNFVYDHRMMVRNTTTPDAPAQVLTLLFDIGESEIPRADAGDDRIVAPGAHVRLIGSGADPGGDPLTYLWDQVEGPDVALSTLDQARTEFDAPVPAQETGLVFTLAVSDGEHDSAADSVRVTVLAPYEGVSEPANNSCRTAPTVGLPYSSPGELEVQHDVDFVAITLAEGEHIEIETFQVGEGVDTTLGVVRRDGSVVLSNDDGGAGLYSKLEFTSEEGGEYCVAVSTFADFAFDGAAAAAAGDYGLVIINRGENTAPLARAGNDEVAIAGQRVLLDGSRSSDPQRDELSFHWTQTGGAEVQLGNAEAAVAAFTAPDVNEETTFAFDLTVNDGEFDASDSVTVTVLPGFTVGAEPNAGPDRTVAEGARIFLVGTAYNPEEAELGWRWDQVGGARAALRDPNARVTEFTAPLVDEPTRLTFRLRLLEGEFFSVDDEVVIEVRPTQGDGEPANNDCRTAPFITSAEYLAAGRLDHPWDVDYVRFFARDQSRFLMETLPAGEEFTDTTLGLARIRDGDRWDLRNTNDDGGLGQMSRISGRFGGDGTICMAVSGHGDQLYFDGSFHEVVGAYNLRLILTPPDGNEPPTVVVPSRLVAEPGAEVVIDASGSSDPNGDPLIFQWMQTAGPEIALEETGGDRLVVQLPPALEEETLFRFTVIVSDGFASDQGATDVLVRPNDSPTLDPVDDITVVEGELVEFQMSGTDPDEDGVSFGVVELPERAVVDAATGAFAWQTRFGDRGTYELQLFARDEFGATATQPMTLTVTEGENRPPTLAPIEPQLIYAEQALTAVEVVAVATDPEEQPLTYAWYLANEGGEPVGEPRGQEPTLALELGPGDYRLVVVVSDGENTVQAATRVLIVGDDQRPIARPGPPQDVPFPDDAETPVAYLDGRASSDPLGRELLYEWLPAPAPGEAVTRVENHPDVPSVGVVYYVGGTDAPRAITATLTVLALDDDFGEIASEPVQVTVQVRDGASPLPTASLGEYPERLGEGESLNLDGGGSRPAGVRFGWSLTRGLGEIDDPTASAVEIALGEPRDPTPVGWTVTLMVATSRASSAPAVAKIRRRTGPPPDMGGPGDDVGPDAEPDAGVDAAGEDEGGAAASNPGDDGCGCATPARRTPSLWRLLTRR